MQDKNESSKAKSLLRKADPSSVDLKPVAEHSDPFPFTDDDGWYPRSTPEVYAPQSSGGVSTAYYEEGDDPRFDNVYIEPSSGMTSGGEGVVQQAGLFDIIEEGMSQASRKAMEFIVGSDVIEKLEERADKRTTADKDSLGDVGVFQVLDEIEAKEQAEKIVAEEDKELLPILSEGRVRATARMSPSFASMGAALGGPFADPNLYLPGNMTDSGDLIDPSVAKGEYGSLYSGMSVKNRIDAYNRASAESLIRYPEKSTFRNMIRSNVMIGVDEIPTMLIAGLAGPNSALFVGSSFIANNSYYEALPFYEQNPDKAAAYGMMMGASDVAVTKSLGKVFGEGFEGMFKNRKVDPVALSSFKDSVRLAITDRIGLTARNVPDWLLRQATPEMLEEATAEVAQQLLTAGFEIDPDAANWENLADAAVQGAVAAVFLTGTTRLAQGFKNSLSAMTPRQKAAYDAAQTEVFEYESRAKKMREEQRLRSLESIESKKEQFVDQMKPDPRSAAKARARSLNIAIREGYNQQSPDSRHTRLPDPSKPPVKVTMIGDRSGRVFQVESMDMLTGMLTIVDTAPSTDVSAAGGVTPRPKILVSPSRVRLDQSTVIERENADPVLQAAPELVQPQPRQKRSAARNTVAGRAAPTRSSGVPKKTMGRSIAGRSQQRGVNLGSRQTEASRIAEESQAIREQNKAAQSQKQPSPDPVIETSDLNLPIQKVFTDKDAEALDSVVLDVVRHNFLFNQSGWDYQSRTQIKDVVDRLSKELNVDKERMSQTFVRLASKGEITIDEETRTVAPSRIFTELFPERQAIIDRTRSQDDLSQEEKIKQLRERSPIDESVIARDIKMRGVSEKFIDSADGRVIVRANVDSSTGKTTVQRIAPSGWSNKNSEQVFDSGTRPAIIARAMTDSIYDAVEFHGLADVTQPSRQDTPAGGMDQLASTEQRAAEAEAEEKAIRDLSGESDQETVVQDMDGQAVVSEEEDTEEIVSEQPASEVDAAPSGDLVDAMSGAYTANTEFDEWFGLSEDAEPVMFVDSDGVTRTATAYKPETGEIAYEFEGDEYTLGFDEVSIAPVSEVTTGPEPVVTTEPDVEPQTVVEPQDSPVEPTATTTEQVEKKQKRRKPSRKKMTAAQRRAVMEAMGAVDSTAEPAPAQEESAATQALIELMRKKGAVVKDKLSSLSRKRSSARRLGRDVMGANAQDFIDNETLEVVGNYLMDLVDNGNADSLGDVVTDISRLFGDDQVYLLEEPLTKAWNKLQEFDMVDPMSAEDMAAVFTPYREKANESVRTDRGTGSTSASSQQGTESGGLPRSPVGQDATVSSGGTGGGRTVQTGVGRDDGQDTVGGRGSVGGRTPTDRTVSGGTVEPQRDGSRNVSDQGGTNRRGDGRADTGNDLTSVLRTDVRNSGLTEEYKPLNDAVSAGVLVPKNHAGPLQRVLKAIRKRRNYLPAFVAKELGIPIDKVEGRDGVQGAFYAEQIDALAMAIDAHKRDQGFVLGDMTGIGKGRVVAGLIAYAKNNGMVPVFVTQSPSLYSAMMQDLHNIGAYGKPDDFNPYITNALSKNNSPDLHSGIDNPDFSDAKVQSKTAAESFAEMKRIKSSKGRLVDGDTKYDAVFTTYDQLRPKKGKTPRHDFIDGISENAFFIFDESHGIGTGSSRNPDGTEKFTTGSFLRDVLKNAKGAAFSSATFAKRSDSLKTYVSAGLNISLDNPNVLLDLFDRGGDALLQIASQMMVENGNMRRLERDFSGITFNSDPIEVDLQGVDNVSNALNKLDQVSKKIVSGFNRDYKRQVSDADEDIKDLDLEKFLKDAGIPDRSGSYRVVDSVRHVASSRRADLWRVVKTLQSSLKTEEAVRQAVEAVENGEKVVLVFDETKEEAIREFAKKRKLKEGDQINFTFREYLLDFIEDFTKVKVKYLDSQGDSNTVTHTIPDEQLDPEVRELIAAARDLAQDIDLEVHGSPIDAVASKLSEMGIEYGELTGRGNVIKNENGVPVYRKRSKEERSASGKNNTIARFNNNTEFNVVLANRAIAEGYSLHASREFDDQRPRKMIVVDLPSDINKVIQLFGRINRANQAELPSYSILTTNAPSENRMASILSAKMKSLNASSTAGTESATTLNIPDYFNFVGEYVLNDVLLDMRGEDIDVFSMIGKRPLVNTETAVRKRMEGDMKWFNEVTGLINRLPVSVQTEIWSRLENDYNAEIERLDQLGSNPLNATVYDFQAKVLETEVLKAPIEDPAIKDGQFGSGVKLQLVEARNPDKLMNERNIGREVNQSLGNETPTSVAERIRSEADTEGNEYLSQRLQAIQDSDMTAEDKAKSSADMKRFVASRKANIETISKYMTGQHVVLKTVGRSQITGQLETTAVPAVILGHDNDGNASDPTSLRDRHVRIAVADQRGSIRIPYASLVDGKYIVEPTDMTRNEVMRIFNQQKSAPTNKRYIATGDTIAAFEMFVGYGSVGYYTTSDGETKPAVIMPMDFNPDQWAESRPLNVRNEDSATEILLSGTPLSFLNGNGIIHSHPDGLLVTMPVPVNGNGVKEIQDGMKEIGVKFEELGEERVRLELGRHDDSRRWESVIQELIRLNGGSVQTTKNHRESRRLASVSEGLVVDDDGINGLGIERDYFNPVKAARRLGRRARVASRQRQRKSTPPKGTVNVINPKVTTDKRGGKDPRDFDVAPAHAVTDDLRDLSMMNESRRNGMLNEGDPEARQSMINAQTVVNNLDKIFGIKTVIGRLSPSDAFGYFSNRAGGLKAEGHVRMSSYASALIGARLHEMAHAIDRRHSITMDYLGDRQASDLAMTQLKSLDYDQTLVRTGNGRLREGWAELFRRFITETTMVDGKGNPIAGLKVEHPDLVDFMEDILNQNQDLKQQVREARRIYKLFEAQGLPSQVESQIDQPAQELVDPTPVQVMAATFDSLARGVNRRFFNRLDLVQDLDWMSPNVALHKGFTLTELLINRRNVASAQGRAAMKGGLFNPRTGGLYFLGDKVSSERESPDDLSDVSIEYATAKAANGEERKLKRLYAFGLARHTMFVTDENSDYNENAEGDDGLLFNTGMTRDQAAAYMEMIRVNDQAEYDAFVEWSEKVSDTGLAILTMKRDAGTLDPVEYNRLYNKYHKTKNYFPLERILDAKTTSAIRLDNIGIQQSTPSKSKLGVKGRSKYGNGYPIENPLISLERQMNEAYMDAAEAEVARELYERVALGMDEGLGEFINILEEDTVVTEQQLKDIVKQLQDRRVIDEQTKIEVLAVNRFEEAIRDARIDKTGRPVPDAIVGDPTLKTLAAMIGIDPKDAGAAQQIYDNMQSPDSVYPSTLGFLSSFHKEHQQFYGDSTRVVFLPNGKKVRVEIQDKQLDAQLRLMNKEDRGFLQQAYLLAVKSLRIGATGNIDFGVQDIGVNYSSALTRAEHLSMKEALLNPFVELNNSFLKRLPKRTAKAVGDILPFIPDDLIPKMEPLDRTGSLEGFLQKQGASSFTETGEYVIAGTKRKRMNRRVLRSTPSKGSLQDKILRLKANIAAYGADRMAGLSSPDNRSEQAWETFVDAALAIYERGILKPAEGMLQMSSDFSAATDMPVRLANARAALAQEGYQSLTKGAYLDPSGKTVYSLPPRVAQVVLNAYANGGLNHRHGGEWALAWNKYIPFANTILQSYWTNLRLLKMSTFDPLVRMAPISESKKKSILGRAYNKNAPFKAAGILSGRLAISYMRFMALETAMHAAYYASVRDDDCYKNSDKTRRDNYYLLCYNGKTVMQVKKSPELRAFHNLSKFLVDSMLGSRERNEIRSFPSAFADAAKTGVHDIGYSLAGGLPAILFQLAINRTFFDKPITPNRERNRSTYLMDIEGRRTSFAARAAAQTGFLNPYYVDHTINGLTANQYKYFLKDIPEAGADVLGGVKDFVTGEKSVAETIEDINMRDMTRLIPGLSALYPMRTEIGPVYEIEDKLDELQVSVADTEVLLGRNSPQYQSLSMERDRVKYMSQLATGLVISSYILDGKYEDQLLSLAAGTARDGLGMEKLEMSKSIFDVTRSKLPVEVASRMDDFLRSMTSGVFPLNKNKHENGATALDSRMMMLDEMRSKIRFLRTKSSSPYLRDYMEREYASKIDKMNREPDLDPELTPAENYMYAKEYRAVQLEARDLLRETTGARL